LENVQNLFNKNVSNKKEWNKRNMREENMSFSIISNRNTNINNNYSNNIYNGSNLSYSNTINIINNPQDAPINKNEIFNNNKIDNNNNLKNVNNNNIINNSINNYYNNMSNRFNYNSNKLNIKGNCPFECINENSLQTTIVEGTNQAEIIIKLKNISQQTCMKGNAKLVFKSSNFGNNADIILNTQNPGEIKKYRIVFNNLSGYPEGDYKSILVFNINGQYIGNPIKLNVVIKDSNKVKEMNKYRSIV